MSVYAPNSDITLISAPLNFGDGNQLDFPGATVAAQKLAQKTYFDGLAVSGAVYSDCTYQRKDSFIRVPALAENLYKYNYCFYTNFDGKRIYAFVTKVEFVNQNCSRVYIVTDVFQTWLFDFTFKQCTVLREHTATDLPYEHTLPENIETGEACEIYRHRATTFDCKGDTAGDFDANFKVAFCMSEALKNAGISVSAPSMTGGVPAAAYYYAVNRANVRDMIEKITDEGQANAIISVYACPIIPNRSTFIDLQATTSFTIYSVNDTNETEVSVNPPKGYYVPRTGVSQNRYVSFKNRKCLCYPFHFYRLWTSDGQSVDLKIENFRSISQSVAETESMVFRTTVNPAQDVSCITAPEKYLFTAEGTNTGNGANYSYGVTYNAFPELAWATDIFKNYMALNKSSVRATMFNTAINTAFGMAQGTFSMLQSGNSAFESGGEGDITGIVSSAGGMLGGMRQVYGAIGNAAAAYAKFKDMQRIPDKIHGLSSVGAVMLSSTPGVYISEMCVKPEYMAVIDEFFTRFGYYVHKLKTPSFKGRVNHNFIQTADCDIISEMPQDDSDELRKMFNAGLTVWHNPSTFGDYSPNNQPV